MNTLGLFGTATVIFGMLFTPPAGIAGEIPAIGNRMVIVTYWVDDAVAMVDMLGKDSWGVAPSADRKTIVVAKNDGEADDPDLKGQITVSDPDTGRVTEQHEIPGMVIQVDSNQQGSDQQGGNQQGSDQQGGNQQGSDQQGGNQQGSDQQGR
jgi:hypothetical protein